PVPCSPRPSLATTPSAACPLSTSHFLFVGRGGSVTSPQHFFPEGHESDKDLFALEAPTPLWRVGGSVPADRKLTMCYRRRSSTIFPVTARLTKAAKASLTRSRGRTSATCTRSRPSARAARAAAFPAAARS